ncbi:N-carbamoyl-L-amino-acid hydrolase [Stella humosa]|uniref:N-carbamoyl-L-amino-acid hydrolase n=1 Tax=Stella humosa TaxID=94 RepID=A0A3N1KWC5_9PROT|nr:N-carbamoyl-L-amino-acid hydrolase [Stella humosa]
MEGQATAILAALDPARLAGDLFGRLARIGADGVGITRETFGPGEGAAFDLLEATARDHGLLVARDAAANLAITLPTTPDGLVPTAAQSCVIVASHLDSVPQGGNFDGAAGVVAGLLSLLRMQAAGVRPQRAPRLMAIRGEESAWYGKAYLGSSALFGQLSADDLALCHRAGAPMLAEAMAGAGADLGRIRAGERLLDPAAVAAYFELHIEQGPVLVARSLPTAIVTGIRGNVRHARVLCRGEAGHSGAVPRWLRRDAVIAMAELISRLDEHWRVLQEQGLDLVVTFGIVGTNAAEHAISRIPGEAAFSFEVRSQSRDTLEAFYHLMRTECRAIERARKVEFVFDRRLDSAPARMDEGLVKRLLAHSRALDLPVETVPSGAGHDAAIFANEGVPSAMIFIRNDKGSHNPEERMDMADFLAGAELLHRALLEATGAGEPA